MAGHLSRLVATVAIALIAPITMAAPAWAHGGDETTEGYLLVQQALGHLAHDASPSGIDLAMEKVQDALDTSDHEGVNVAEVRESMAALKAGNVTVARTRLQDSIRQAMRDLPPPTGNQTGTTMVTPELAGRSGLHGQDWLFLAASLLVLLLGSFLTYRFRPPEPLRVLRARLAAEAATPGGSAVQRHGVDHDNR